MTRAFSACVLLLLAAIPAWSSAQKRLPTLEDAAAVRSTDAIELSRDGKWLAVESGGDIRVFGARHSGAAVKSISGHDAAWSPNGCCVAFYTSVATEEQLAVWNMKEDTIEFLTAFENGLSPSPFMLEADTRPQWAPDSASIAFTTRIMGDYKSEGHDLHPTIRVFTSRDRQWLPVLDDVFATPNWWDGYISSWGPRTRASERHHDWALNVLFTVNVSTRELRRWNQKGQYFSPSWSPDGRQLLAVAEADSGEWDEFPEVFPWVRYAELALFDVQSGAKQLIRPSKLSPDSEYEYVGPATFSADGARIVVRETDIPTGFWTTEVYSLASRQWRTVPTPGGMNTDAVRWAAGGRQLLIQTADRFSESRWLVDPESGSVKPLDLHGLLVGQLQQGLGGDSYVIAQGPTFKGRVYRIPEGGKGAPQLLFDPNPRLTVVNFGRQEQVTWTNAAGDSVDGIVIYPADYSAGTRYPVLVDPYPMKPRNGFKLNNVPQEALSQLNAVHGYVIFIPSMRMPHGGYNFTRDRQYTEKARGVPGLSILLDDFTSGIGYLAERGLIDPNRVGVMGHSNGGYATNLLITHSSIPRCAVVASGINNVVTGFPAYSHVLPGYDFMTNTTMNIVDNTAAAVQLSPLFQMRGVTASVLLILGDDDWTWVPQMIDEYGVLHSLGKDVTLVRYAGEGHVFGKPENIRDSYERITRFFDECLAADKPGNAGRIQ